MIYIIPLWISSIFFSNIVGKVSDQRCVNYYTVPVYDIWNEYFFYLPNLWFLPDIFIGIFAGIFINSCSLDTILDFLLKHAILNFIRCACCFSTTGYVSIRYDRFNSNQGMFNCYFSDMCISGHAMTMTLLYLFTYTISVYFMTGLLLVSLLSILMVGDHYTSDVILGISLSLLIQVQNRLE